MANSAPLFSSEELNCNTADDKMRLVSDTNFAVLKTWELPAFFQKVSQEIVTYRAMRKRHYYWFVDNFYYKRGEGMTDKQWRTAWREILGDDYANYINYGRAIHIWKESGVDYPTALNLRLLQVSYKLSKADKKQLVAMFLDETPNWQIEAWAKIRLAKSSSEAELEGLAYLEAKYPDTHLEYIVAFCKKHGEDTLLQLISDYEPEKPN